MEILENQRPGDRLGDFEILREIGRGGMGVVYEARQVSLKRRVALKVLAAGLGLSPRSIKRFQREAAAAAKLHHTNIVPIYATGESDGVYYYAMELVEGPSLHRIVGQVLRPGSPESSGWAASDELLQELEETLADEGRRTSSGRPPLGETTATLRAAAPRFEAIARMIAEVADALDYAHQRGVIHRDIKPSNLLLSPEGRLSINDFGLARMLEEPGMTLTGECVGSPLYMSPEQIAAGRAPMDHRTDIYSLGATLYELLTLQPPFPGQAREQILAQIIQKEPRRPRRLKHSIPVDLETICLKALEKDPDRRYQTAGQMADDLRRYANRYAISARRAGPLQQTVKWVRRRPGLAAAVGCAFLLAALATWSGWQAHLSWGQLEEAKRQRAIDTALAAAWAGDRQAAEEAVKEAELNGAPIEWVRMLDGQIALYDARTDEAIEHLKQAVELAPESVAAKAMLATAYLYKGQTGRFSQLLGELGNALPVTAEDHLFLGQALIAAHPDTAHPVALLKRAIQMHPSGVALLQLALAEAFYAADTGSWATVRTAIDHAESAKVLLGTNHPVALAVSLNAHNLAARLCPEDQRSGVLEEAARAAHALDSTTYHISHMQRAFYFELRGNDEAVLKEWQRAIESGGVGLYASYYAAAMYGAGKGQEALNLLSGLPPPIDGLTRIAQAYLLLEYQSLEDAEPAYQDASRDAFSIAFAETILLLAGDGERVVANCNRMLGSIGVQHPHHRMLQYLAGQTTDQEFLHNAGASRRQQCEVHFCIALKHLSRGDRSTARQHFRRSLATGTHWLPSFHWCRAFLARMEQDDRWPRWIQAATRP